MKFWLRRGNDSYLVIVILRIYLVIVILIEGMRKTMGIMRNKTGELGELRREAKGVRGKMVPTAVKGSR